ncbi:MAG TPA: hypothetical protein PKA53_13005 [Sphingobacterium sp.]|nr:hypothetical protein [Sphingobacterium sp.]
MFKILFIGALLAILVFFIVRRLGFFGTTTSMTYLQTDDWIEIRLDNRTLKQAVKKTLFSVLIGFVLLIVVLVIAAKFRIALFMLPISFYLIGQYFILINQIKTLKKQQMYFHRHTQQVKINSDEGNISFNLRTDVVKLKEVKSVQKNNGLLLGYYKILTTHYKVVIPFILQENLQNKPFFDELEKLPKEIVSKLFPII